MAQHERVCPSTSFSLCLMIIGQLYRAVANLFWRPILLPLVDRASCYRTDDDRASRALRTCTSRETGETGSTTGSVRWPIGFEDEEFVAISLPSPCFCFVFSCFRVSVFLTHLLTRSLNPLTQLTLLTGLSSACHYHISHSW